MSGPRPTPMSDDALDRRLATFLASEAADMSGAPTAAEVTWRIAQRDRSGRQAHPGVASRQLRTVLLLGALGLLLGLTLALLSAQRPTDPLRLTGNGEIVVEDQVFHPVSGAELPSLCDGCRRTGVPSFSADGSRMAFASHGLWVLDVRTGTPTRLDACPGCSGPVEGGELANLSMAPAGDRVAYVESGQLKVVDVATNAVHALTRPGDVVSGVTFAPNGEQIAFVREPGIWVIDADGRHERLVMEGDAIDPAWSPDGSTIAYVRFGGWYELWLYDTDSAARRVIWESPKCCISGWGGPAWSPDGREIAVVTVDDERRYQLSTISVESGRARRVGPASPGRPAWRPVSAEAAYTVDATGPVVSPAGSASTCADIHVRPDAGRVPPGSWDATGLGDGLAVGVPEQVDDPTSTIFVASGTTPAIMGMAVDAPRDVVVTVRPVSARPSGEAVVLVTATSTERSLANCSDLWRISVTDRVPHATRLTSNTGGQDVEWSSVSPSGARIAYVIDDTTGNGPVRRMYVDAVASPGAPIHLGAPLSAGCPFAPPSAAWAPDEQALAQACGTTVEVVDLATGQRSVLDLPRGMTPTALTWRPPTDGDDGNLLVGLSPDGVDGPLTVAAIDPLDGTTDPVGTWDGPDGQPLEWLGGWDDAFSPGHRWLWTLGPSTGSTDQAGYLIDMVTGRIALGVKPDDRPDMADWVGVNALGVHAHDVVAVRIRALDPMSGRWSDIASLPSGTWVAWVP